MARSRRRQPPRRTRVRQKSPFLDLPGEIRTLIYRAALISPKPIDLWPHEFVEKPEDDPALAPRIAQLRKKGKILESWVPIFRKQDDLQYVRKELGIGLLATCRQINQEATLFFWQDNTFRFSGDFDWLGMRRFLATIGPNATSSIRNIEAFLPENSMPWKNAEEMSIVEYRRGCDARNTPKLKMAKAYEKGDRPWWINISDVCLLLAEANSSLNLRFILPREFVLLQDSLYPDCCMFELIEDLQDRAPATKLSVIIEPGAILEGVDTPDILVDAGLDVVCMPGSFWDREKVVSQNLELRHFKVDQRLEYLNGVKRLFTEEEKIEVPALGGRVTLGPGYRMERVLKGFGGAKLREASVYFCPRCGLRGVEYKGIWISELMRCDGCSTYGWHTRQKVYLRIEENGDTNDPN